MPRSRRVEYSWLTARLCRAGSRGCAQAQAAAWAASVSARAAAAGCCGCGSDGPGCPLVMRMPPELGFRGWSGSWLGCKAGRAGRDDDAGQVGRVDLHVLAGLRCLDDLAAAEVHHDVAGIGGRAV